MTIRLVDYFKRIMQLFRKQKNLQQTKMYSKLTDIITFNGFIRGLLSNYTIGDHTK